MPSDAPRLRGVVQRLYAERGFGFIRVADRGTHEDYFFHASGLDGCEMFDLEEGTAVEFEARQTAKGQRAEQISRVP